MDQPNAFTSSQAKQYLPWLWLLTTIFLLRIAGQALQNQLSIEFFNSEHLWMGSGIPYPILLLSQLMILSAMFFINGLIHDDKFKLSAEQSNALRWISLVYAGVMVARLIVGYTFLEGHSWFDKPIPTLSHLMLALYLLTLACISDHHGRLISTARSYLIYPAALLISLSYFSVFVQNTNMPLFLIVNLLVGLTMTAVFFLEIAEPYQQQWIPKKNELISDALFLVVIQILLPKMITYGTVLFAISNPQMESTVNWIELDFQPAWLQVITMIITADFFRYWFHRCSHTNKILWKLHKVHHNPNKLYTVNVGRFHVLDKAIHVLIDTVPFIILGVSELVISIYFLCYAVNGIFQHSNLPLRFGLLNYIISTSELHRWHHSVLMKEAQSNFGNTTIVWDLLCGSYYNPHRDQVRNVGISRSNRP